ncbi:DinB family protein [Paenibacillus sp. JX-17]|uniref:DinB family protein n=1 Tax=Paenibacillus lacisoli TaxID=3064525 RepID=A0ABT9CCC7_9BACL|nr:DinB family protein [Paenibacillus sp. JX-17]MDO7905637.1 DinB family protein [Paenibacillus sp. JX-17]
MYVRITEFADEWTREMQITEKVMNALTNESLSQIIAPERRTLGQLAWHLVESLHYMTHCGLAFDEPDNDAKEANIADLIAREYSRISRALLNAVQTQWDDHRLHDTIEMMGEPWANGASLHFTLMHQAHHRGQMTVLMRQAGLRVPEVYGPTYESWLEQGAEPLT